MTTSSPARNSVRAMIMAALLIGASGCAQAPGLTNATEAATARRLTCAGWRAIPYATRDAETLIAANAEALATAIIRHNDFGKEKGCWKD